MSFLKESREKIIPTKNPTNVIAHDLNVCPPNDL